MLIQAVEQEDIIAVMYNYSNSNFLSKMTLFIPLDSILSPASDGVNIIINFLLIKKLKWKRNYCEWEITAWFIIQLW